MAESLAIPKEATKQEIYKSLLPQIKSIMSGEDNLIANLANITAILHTAFQNLWVGFYIIEGNGLVLGPFQGPLACTRIPVYPNPKGVCGAAAFNQKTYCVPDVDKFKDHIACSSQTRSEIVVPLVSDDLKTQLVLDIDSIHLNHFDEIDQLYCEKIVELIKEQHFKL